MDTNDAILMLMKQNQELIQALQGNLAPKPIEETPKKGGKNG
jgi:hypothetical protein